MASDGRGSLAWIVAVLALAAGATALLLTEAPYGTVTGRVWVDSGQQGTPPAPAMPLPPKVSLWAENLSAGGSADLRCDATGAFRGRLPVGHYRVTAQTRILEGHANLEVREGQHVRLDLPLKPQPSRLQVTVHRNVTPSGEPAEIAVQGHVRDAALQVRLYRVDLRKLSLEARGNLRRLADPQFTYRTRIRPGGNPDLVLAGEKTETITTRDAEGMFYQRVHMDLPAPGVYLATVDADGLQDLGWVMQSDIALLVKSDRERMLAQVCELVSGRPVPGAQVELYGAQREPGEDPKPLASGQTDGQGLLPLALPPSTDGNEATVIASSMGSEAFVASWLSSTATPPLRVYFITDRPIYRPGHRVQFKLLARRPDGERYTVPANEEVRVQLRDPNDTLLYDRRLRFSEWGSCADAVELSDEAATGEYTLECVTPGRELTHYFTVAAYRKPEYEVTVTPERERVVRGDTVTATVQASYYFGSPVANARVRYNVYSSPYWFWEPDDEAALEADYYGEEEYLGYADYGGELAASGTVRTDAAGRATIRVPTRRGAENEETDRQFALEAVVTDASGRSVTGEATVLVLRGDLLITLEPERWITEPGKPVPVAVRVRDAEHRTPVAGLPLLVGWEREEWREGKRQSRDQHLEPLTTTAAGAQFTVTPDRPGDYRIVVRATAQRGNRITETTGLWCTSQMMPAEGHLREGLQITLDQRVYQPGERAQALIFSAEPVETALLTIEGERLYDWQVLALRKGSTLVELPVAPEYLPNAYVVVSTVYKQDLHQAQKRLNVSPREHALRVEVGSDKTEYAPGETATCNLTVREANGDPARAEVTLGVVDESIYALAADLLPDPLKFFYAQRENLVNTDYSFPSVYLSADKAGTPDALRKHFPDTAYWNPSVVTDAAGRAQVSFTVPDTLTKWRITARAATQETNAGQRLASFTCRKPFFVRLETPRFVTEGDRTEVAAIVHNETGAPLQASVTLQVTGGQIASAHPTQRVNVGADPVRVAWPVTASTGGGGSGKLQLSVTAQAGPQRDGVQMTLPVNVWGRTVRSQAAGVAEAGRESTGTVELQSGNIARKLEVRLTNSLLATASGGLEYLAQYPYGCVEQTMSCFLPGVVLCDTLQGLGRTSPALARRLPAMVRDGLTRLYTMQNADGGWGWWRYDKPDAWMTAYVLYGMGLARRSGFAVNENVCERGLDTLRTYVEQTRDMPADALALAALALAQGGQRQAAELALQRAGKAPGYGTVEGALIVRALWALDERDRARRLLDQLLATAQTTGLGLYWPGRTDDWKPFTNATAETLVALLEVNPRDDRAAGCVRWLVGQRRGGGWTTTLDTAAAVTALCRYLRQHPPAAGPVTAAVTVNGRVVRRVELGPATTEQPEAAVFVAPQDLVAGANTVQVRTTGAEEVWWTAELRQTATATAAGRRPAVPVTATAGLGIVSTYHRVGPVRDWNRGETVTRASDHPTTRFRAGAIIEGHVVVQSARPVDYVMVEVPLPAGCEALTRGELSVDEWDAPYDDVDVRDDRVCFFLRRLEKPQTITYRLRALTPGHFGVAPAQVAPMYQPERAAWTPGVRVEVR